MTTRSLPHFLLAWAFVLFYMAVIFYLSHQPSVPIPMRFPHQDKLFHLGAYFLLAALLAHAFGGSALQRRKRFFWAFLIAAMYGVSDEIHQSFVPGRDASLGDILADAVGAWFGAFFYLRAENSLTKPPKPQ